MKIIFNKFRDVYKFSIYSNNNTTTKFVFLAVVLRHKNIVENNYLSKNFIINYNDISNNDNFKKYLVLYLIHHHHHHQKKVSEPFRDVNNYIFIYINSTLRYQYEVKLNL